MRIALLLTLFGSLGLLAAIAVTREAGGQIPDAPPGESGTTDEAPPPPPATTVEAAPVPVKRWRSRERGIELTYPARWTLRTDGSDFADPGLCFEFSSDVRPPGVSFHGSRAPHDGVEIRVTESFGGQRGRDRRQPFSLARLAPGGGARWTSGGLYAFREHGRNVTVGVALGPDAAPAVLAEVERLVSSVALARSGRCLPPAAAAIQWRRSTPLGLPYAGRLVGGVQVPAEGHHFFTWDPVLRRSPDRPGRRWGTAGVVRRTLAIVDAFARAHPEAPRVGIGDLSRERGGPFGPKHASHQNGLDVDVYYPRKDGLERPPKTVAQVDRRVAQDLVNRFVAAGATKVFVGPNLALRGPRGVVVPLWNHDNHLHARFPPRRAQ